MLPFHGAPPPRGFPQVPGAPPPRPIMGGPAAGLPPRGMPPPQPMGAPFVHAGGNGMPLVPPVVLGPRGIGAGAPRTESQQDPGPVNVFVGKLPPDLHDNYIRRLLGMCGTVATWMRMTDPVTNKPKGFGYCTYAHTLDVLRALRLLNGFAIDSRQILLKVDSKSQEKLNAFERALPDHVRTEEQAVDESVKQTLRAIYEARSGVKGGQQNDATSWGDLIEGKGQDQRAGNQGGAVDSGTKGTDGDTNGGGEAVGNKDKGDVSGDTEGSGAPGTGEKVRGKMIMSEIEKFRLAQKERDQELERKRHEAVREHLRLEREQEQIHKTEEEEQEKREQETLAAETKALKDKQAREEGRRQPEGNTVVNADKRKGASDEHSRDVESSRKRDSKPSERRERSRSRGRGSRRRERSCSRSRSLEKRDRRSNSWRHRQRHGSRDGGKSGNCSRSRSRSRSHHRSDPHRSKRRSRSHSRGRREHRRQRKSSDVGALDASDDNRGREPERKRRRKWSISDEKRSENRRSPSPRIKSSRLGSTKLPSVEEDQEDPKEPTKSSIKELPKVVLGLKLQSNASKKDKPVPAVSVLLAFGVEDDVKVKPKRDIVPIDYTDGEAPSSAEQSAPTENVDANKLKALIERIPTDRDALFAFPINWAIVNAQGLVESKMRAWVDKKVLEYLGEEEPTMVNFVLAKLREHVHPQVILDELRAVLEDEADIFVALLWRKLAFEAARANLL